jgi:two-component system LytT family response regulator
MTEATCRVIVVDDEPLARAGIRTLVEREPGFTVLAECRDGPSAVDAIERLAPDLVLLDIQMPEMDGFEVIEAVGPKRMPAVVFITAHDRHAVRAFDASALDYLLKPFDDQRFQRALARARQALGQRPAGELSDRLTRLLDERGPLPYHRRLPVRTEGRTRFVAVEQIDWIEAAGASLRLHAGPTVHTTRGPLTALEARLDPARFVRIHRSTIVSLDRVQEVQPYFHGDAILILHDGTRLRVSRDRREAVERALLG